MYLLPVQYWASERGGDGVSPDDAAMIVQNLPVKADFRIVPNSGHFDFLPPCTPEFAKRTAEDEPQLCSDTTGFDRAAFHKRFNADILTFFRKYLIEANQ